MKRHGGMTREDINAKTIRGEPNPRPAAVPGGVLPARPAWLPRGHVASRRVTSLASLRHRGRDTERRERKRMEQAAVVAEATGQSVWGIASSIDSNAGRQVHAMLS